MYLLLDLQFQGAAPFRASRPSNAPVRKAVSWSTSSCSPACVCGHGARGRGRGTQVGIDFGRLTTLAEMDELMRRGAPDAPGYDDEVLLACSCSVIEIQTSSITNRWYRFWCRVGIFTMQCAGTMMTQHLITIKKVAGPRPGAVRLATPSGSRDANEDTSSSSASVSSMSS